MSVRVEFDQGSGFNRAYYCGEPLMERMSVTIDGPLHTSVVNLAGRTAMLSPMKDPVGDESRRDYGDRLREAARRIANSVESLILSELRRQGHLIP